MLALPTLFISISASAVVNDIGYVSDPYYDSEGNMRKRPNPSNNKEWTCTRYERVLGLYLIKDRRTDPAWYSGMVVSREDDLNLQIFGDKVIEEIGKNPIGVAQYIRSGKLYNDCVKVPERKD